MQDNIYNTAAACLGQHLTLDPSVPFEVGCAEAVSTILAKAGVQGIPQRGFAGTWDLYQWLRTNRQFVEVVAPTYGSIVVSPTDPDNPTKHGHTGIVLKHGIGSNDSSNGLFAENYTTDSWNTYFGKVHGFPVHYFCPCG